jgi:polyferredoxin
MENILSKLVRGGASDPIFKKKPVKRNTQFRIKPWRRVIQTGFVLITIWIGFEFVLFVRQLQQGQIPSISRPPGVEAFLPISALISLKYWLLTGIFNTIHPAALVLLLLIGFTALFMKKGFCGWVCPVGFLSEMLARLHIGIFDRQWKLPRLLDYPMRSLKYLLLGFFAYAVFAQMNLDDLHKFIYSPYNKVADIKMLLFFSEMSQTTFWALVILVLLSLGIPYFWCRYLCPYGALLGGLSWLSPFKIHRNRQTCIDCEKCTNVCPAKIIVHKAVTVMSDECHACMNCVDACPVKDTLYLSVSEKRARFPRKIYAAAIVLLFLAGVITARLSGVWQNSISTEEYQNHIRHLNDPDYFHLQGQVPAYDERQSQDHQKLKPE